MTITDYIPQREPFLFINKIEEIQDAHIVVSMEFNETLDFFRGHFPNDPIVPGVILSEHCFQSGAALISSKSTQGLGNKLAVLSRIQSAKFKSIVRPNEKISTKTTLIEQLDNAAFFKSIITNSKGKKVLIIEFACTLMDK